MNPLATLLTATLAAASALAQSQALVVPAAATNAQIGSTPNVWPDNVVRVQCIYDASHFTSQLAAPAPITIERLEFRLANGASTNIVIYGSVHAYLSYSAVDYLTPSTTFATNRTVPIPTTPNFMGPVTTLAVSGGSPNGWFVDLPLQVPFVYDPTLGQDLLLELVIWSYPFLNVGNNTSSASNVTSHRCNSIRSFGSTNATTGTQSAFPPVVRIGYTPLANAAYNLPIGQGCYQIERSYYELFPALGNDLGGRTVTMQHNAGGGYDVSTSVGATVVPPTGIGLGLDDDVVSPAIGLPFSFDYPGGSTSTIHVDSNGSILLGATGPSTNGGAVADLLDAPTPRLAPAMMDLEPDGATNVANVFAESAPGNPGVFLITWNAVPNFGASTPSTFQIALIDNGTADVVEFRYQNLVNDSTSDSGRCITGFSLGSGALDGGSLDLTAGPISTATDMPAMRTEALSRPFTDANWNLRLINVPPTTTAGVAVFGVADPGVDDLFFIDMPGCGLRSTLDAQLPFLPSGPTHTYSIFIPDDPSLNGLHLYSTGAVLTTPPQNPFGVLTSSAIDGRLGLQ